MGGIFSDLVLGMGFDYLFHFLGMCTVVGSTGFIFAFIDMHKKNEAAKDFYDLLGRIKGDMKLSDIMNALQWSAGVSIGPDGVTVSPVFSTINTHELNVALRTYARMKGIDNMPSAEEIEAMIRSGQYTDDHFEEVLEGYISWYNRTSTDHYINEYKKVLRDACEQKYGREKNIKDLTNDEILQLEEEYPDLFPKKENEDENKENK